MKKLSLALMLAVLFITFVAESCQPDNADRKQRKATDQLMNEAERQIGMPNIVNFQERKLAKMIFELRDKEDLICYAYIKSDYTGKLHFIGKCVGFGLPYSVQYTNPEKYIGQGGAMPQPDPNGLFMPGGLSATWLMMIDPNTKQPRPVYIEAELVVSPFKLASVN